MKQRMKKLIGILVLLITVQSLAQSSLDGKEGGNGGDGVMEGGVPYLYDLWESSVHKNPVFDMTVEINPQIKKRVEQVFLSNSTVPHKLLTIKLSEIAKTHNQFAYAMTLAMTLYSWRWSDNSLKDVKDDGDTVIDFDKNRLIQLAIRKKSAITIDKKYWNQMNDGNRVALILHEIAYALILPEAKPNNAVGYFQDSESVRSFVGYLFTNQLTSNPSAMDPFLNKYFDNLGFHSNHDPIMTRNEIMTNISFNFTSDDYAFLYKEIRSSYLYGSSGAELTKVIHDECTQELAKGGSSPVGYFVMPGNWAYYHISLTDGTESYSKGISYAHTQSIHQTQYNPNARTGSSGKFSTLSECELGLKESLKQMFIKFNLDFPL